MENSEPMPAGQQEAAGGRANGRPPVAELPPPLLSMDGVTKHYGGVRALTDVSLDIAAGEVHALVGANGAGKSTLVRILAGLKPRIAGSRSTASNAPSAVRGVRPSWGSASSTKS